MGEASHFEEPRAVVPHAGICAGAVGQLAVLPRWPTPNRRSGSSCRHGFLSGRPSQRSAPQCRVIVAFRRPDGRALHVCMATHPEPAHLNIIQALGSDPASGVVHTMIV
jgi:hypothetical protein